LGEDWLGLIFGYWRRMDGGRLLVEGNGRGRGFVLIYFITDTEYY
jgi:hypothetical protein